MKSASLHIAVGFFVIGVVVNHFYPISPYVLKRLADVAEYRFDSMSAIGIKGKLALKWVEERDGEGKMLSKLRFDNFPEQFKQPSRRDEKLAFSLEDKDGFEVTKISFQLSKITRQIGSGGTLSGGEAELTTEMTEIDYRRISSIKPVINYCLMKAASESIHCKPPSYDKVICSFTWMDDHWVSGIPKDRSEFQSVSFPPNNDFGYFANDLAEDKVAKVIGEHGDGIISICPAVKLTPD